MQYQNDIRRHRLISISYISLLPVTAEAAGSSPVVPAISNQALTEMAPSRRRHEKVPKRYKRTPPGSAHAPYFRIAVPR
jgi:hypothetical protein